MKTEYLRTAKNSYMIIKEADFYFEPYELEMVIQNELKYLVPIQVVVSDGKVEYWFDVTGMKALELELSVAEADKEMIRMLLESICNMKMELEEYLLDDRDISYRSAMVFRNRSGNRMQFCYIPGYHSEKTPGVRGLFEELLQHLNHMDSEAVRMTYGMYERCGIAEPVMEDYREILYGKSDDEMHMADIREEKVRLKKESNLSEPVTVEKNPQSDAEWDFPAQEFFYRQNTKNGDYESRENKKAMLQKHSFFRMGKRKKNTEQMMHYEAEQEANRYRVAESIPDFGNGETVCFEPSDFERIWELTYIGNGVENNLTVSKFPYIVGKNSSLADGILQAQTVSRVHARIMMEQEKLFIEDHNSTNGTYLNGHLIPMNTRVPLQEEDHIIFATEEFILKSRTIPKQRYSNQKVK